MFLVVFRNRKRADIDDAAYQADAARMAALASQQHGYLGFKGYAADDGEVVAISEWASEADARAWGQQAEHAVIQGRGREAYYQDYTLFACAEPRIHHFDRTKP